MKKRVLSMLMTLALCLTLFPAPAWAAEDAPEIGATVQQEQQEEQQEASAAEPSTILEQAAENGIAVQDGGDSTVENAVAEVTINGSTTTQYTDIAAAFAAAQQADSATVKLLENVTIPTNAYGYSYGIKLTSGDITLDLNGRTIQTTGGTSGFVPLDAVFYISDGGSLTVQDSGTGGKIVQPNAGQAIGVSGGTLTVKSGIIEVTSDSAGADSATAQNCAVFVRSSGVADIQGGTLIGNRGIYIGGKLGGGTLTVSGGMIHGKSSYALEVVGGSAALSGGSYTTGVSGGCSIWNAGGTAANLPASGYRYQDDNGKESAYSEDGKGVVGNATVALRPANEYAYIDKNGNPAKQTNCTEITADTTTLTDGWYVVKEDVTISGDLLVKGPMYVHLILCDGKTLTVTGSVRLQNANYSLCIYGQSEHTGTLKAGSAESTVPAIAADAAGGRSYLNIYGGTVTVQAKKDTYSIGETTNSDGLSFQTGSEMKTVPTDSLNTYMYWYDNSGVSLTITKCKDHVWEYTDCDEQGHTAICELCSKDGGMVAHSYDTLQSTDAENHTFACVCGATSTEKHTLTSTPNDDGLTHKISCKRCGWTSADEKHTFGENGDCVCGRGKSAEYGGQEYASLQAAVNAAATSSGGTVTLARDVSENVTVTGGTLTVDLNGKTWNVNENVNSNIIQKIPLTVTGGSVTLKNGTISQELPTDGKCGIQITGGSVTVEGDAVVIGSNKDGDAQLPPAPAIELENGDLTLAPGATLVYGLKVPEGKTLSDYLPAGTAFGMRSYDESTKAWTVDKGLLNAYTINNYAEHNMALVVVEHTKHEFALNSDGKYVCACGYVCPHNDFKDGKCTICGNECAHTDVGDDGVCRNCKMQMAVKITASDSTVTYGTDFAAAMRNATNGTKITLLADVSIPSRTGISGDGTTVTLDLNGHKITSGWLDVGGKDTTNGTYTTCTLKIIGKGSYEPPLYGGIITVNMKATLDLSEWEGGTISSINISDNSNYEAATREAAVIVGPKAGTIGELSFGNNQLDELKKTKLSGGSFNEIWVADFGPVKLGELLADGYAFQNGDGSYVEYGTTLQGASIYNVKVVKCPHAKINEDGHCAYCNATGFVAQVTAADGSSSTYTDIAAAIAAADGGTVKLLANADEITISSPLKLDLNGKTAAKLTVTGDVTLASLLPDGYAFKSDSTWISDLSGTELTNVSMAKIPIKSLDYPTEMSMTYGGAGTLLVKVEKETGTGAVSFQWYKVEDGKETAVGSATTKNQFNLVAQKLPAGNHTFRFSATCDGYKKVSQDIAVTVQKANISANLIMPPTAQENLTYTGQEQALIIAGSVEKYGTMQYSLTENGTYSQAIPIGTDAGAYTVWYRVIGDANHNDTAPASVAVRIGKKPLTITGVTAASKPYDGTTNADISSVTFDGVNLNRGTDYTVTANFDDAGVDNDKHITATVTLRGQTAKNYALEQSSFTTTGSITKAAAPGSGLRPAVTVINNLAKTYEMVLSNDYLPKLSPPCEYGNVSYSFGGTYLADGYKNVVQAEVVEENGQYKLKLTVPAVDYNRVGSLGTLWLYVSSDNYQDFSLDIGVKAKNKDVPVPDGTISASDITYGQALNDSKIAGKMKAGGKAIDGTFTWTNGTFKPAANDSYEAEWTFTPDAPEYATVTGKATVEVAPKSIEGATITLEKREFKYNAAEQSPKITGVTLKGWSDTITYHIVDGDKATNANNSITLTIEGTGNYTGTATAEWKIIPAELTVSVQSVTKEYDGTPNATVTPTFNGLKGKDTLTAADYSVTAAFEDAKVGYFKPVTGKVKLNQTATAKNYLLNDENFKTDNGTIAKAAAPTVQPVELTIYNGVQKVYFVDLPSLPPLDEGKSYGTVEYRKTPTINLSEGYIAQSELAADPENLNTLRLLLRMKQTGSLTGEIGTVTIPVTTSNYQDINLTVKVSAVNQIKPEPDGTITASEITYGNELSMSTITGKMKDPDTGDAVKGTFTWMDGTVKPDAGSNNATWTFTPDASYGEKYTTNNGTATVTVNRKTVTVSGITAKDKAYDGNTNAVLNYSAVTLDGILENDTLTVTAKGVFEKADIGKQKVTISDLTLGGASAANYVLAESGNQSETTATITAREVTVTITSKGGTYGSVVAAAAKLTGAVDGDNVPVTLTYTGNNYSSATVPVNVGSYTVTASIANSNYTLTGKTTADFVITPKAVTVSGITANDKVYDGTNDATLDCSNAKFGGVLENDTLTVTAKGMFEKADVGEQKVRISDLTLDGASAANYVLAGSGNQAETTATITAKEVTVTITPNGGTYGETITPATVTANGVVGEDAPKITLTYTGTANDGTKYTGTTPPTKAGTYTITATITNPNYKLDADTATAEFTVAKRSATVTPDNKSKVYEEKDPELTYKVSGVLDGEMLKGITLARAKGENAGKYAITATADASANPNYDVTFAEGTFTIEPKSIKGATVVLGKGLAANGAEQTQTVEKVLLGDKEIPADSYTVTGNTATAYGIYTLTITAKDNYTDSITWTYVIAPSKAEDAPGEEITIGSGKVKVDVKSEGAVPSVGLLTDKAELLAMLVNSGDITADELVQIANGASVDIVLTVKEANVPDVVKTAMAQAAKGYTIGQYLDISLFKYMTVNGNRQPDAALHTTKNALPISVVVPDALINTNSAVNRTYCIVRNHEGTITVLDAAFDAANKTLTFKTDRFSVYAIAYKDTAVPSSGSNPGSNNSSNDSETKKNEVAPTPAPTPASTPARTSKPSTITAMPQTGDTSNPTLYVVLLVVSLLGLAVIFVCKKRNDK